MQFEHFRNRLKLEYLTSLRECHRNTGNNRQEIKVGEVVQIHDDTYRNQWELGIIDKPFTGEDNRVRSVRLKTARGYTNRPIGKLYPLEITVTEATSAEGRLSRATKEAAITKIVNIELNFECENRQVKWLSVIYSFLWTLISNFIFIFHDFCVIL